MDTIIIHLSDLHFRSGWIEEQGVVIHEFFKDLERQIEKISSGDIYLAFSGDIIQAGGDPGLYDELITLLDDKFCKLNIPKSHRICVPGNHDISIDTVKKSSVEHEGIISQNLNETTFNNYVLNQPNILTSKFVEYNNFEGLFANYGVGSGITGAGWEINPEIGIYCLNSALCASGGTKNPNGQIIKDEGRLAVDTRSLQDWHLKSQLKWKILIMHHPLSRLTDWAQKELGDILEKDFSLLLYGHDHSQSIYHSVNKESNLIKCSAPPLFTNKNGELGYSFITISPEEGVKEIFYRQWTKYRSFVTGGNFSNSDDGKVRIAFSGNKPTPNDLDTKVNLDFIERYLSKKLDDALISFSSQPIVWVEPTLHKCSEISREKESDEIIELSDLISLPKSTIIKSPPQFGLTCLAHYLAREAWRSTNPALWLYLDAKELRPNFAFIEKTVKSELKLFGCEKTDIKCVLLDSWEMKEKYSINLLQNVCNLFSDVPVIVMNTIDNSEISSNNLESLPREFDVLYLWSLTRGSVRKVVSEYNEKRHIGEEDSVLSKIVTDLEVLNLHRTPLNCVTLLKVSEIDFDESPVNRTEMIKRVLFLLFNVDSIPTYKIRPDLKDCEYVLGYFCEILLRNNNYSFSRNHFISVLQEVCRNRVIDLDVDIVFDVLHLNNIIISRNGTYCFRFTYWIYYFAARRMHHNNEFAEFIFEDMRYTRYPEIIEFYTGIDRRREDALKILIDDIRTTYKKLQTKCGLPDDLNPFRLMEWKPSTKMIEKMENEISNGILESNLPAVVRDQFADRQYDQTKPYQQEIRDFLNEYSVILLMEAVKAAARALRNSDYADPDIKRQLLQEIMLSGEQLAKVLLVISPALAINEYANFEGASFLLNSDFGKTPDERWKRIIAAIPFNIVSWFKDDIFSQKMGPLLIERFLKDDNELRRHILILFLIYQRPRDWKTQVESYISNAAKNSFYLMDVYISLCTQYSYSYASSNTLHEIEYLIKMAAAKHSTGHKKPGVKLIKKVADSVLPNREVE